MKKLIRLLALLLLVVLCVSACAEEEQNPDATGTQDTSDTGANPDDTSDTKDSSDISDTSETEKVIALAEADALILAQKEQTDFVVVVDDSASKEVKSAVTRFTNAFSEKTGAAFETKDDTDNPKKNEILIYTMDDRDEVDGVFKKITAPEQNGFRIEVDGSKIIVACDDVMYLENALELLSDAIRLTDNGSYGIEKNYVGSLDLPKPVVNATSTTRVLYTGSNNQTVWVSGITKSNYTSFTRSLTNDGFSTYVTNSIGDAQFGTYVKDSQFAKEAVYTMYYPEDGSYQIVYGPLGYLPEMRAASTKTVTPSFAQLRLIGGVGGLNAPGMCQVVQCADGKYIIFDGGQNNAEDKETLFNYLKDNHPGTGTPTVAAWIMTHAHGDHMDLANAFLKEYFGQISLERIVCNFPEWDDVSVDYEGTTAGAKSISTRLLSLLAESYPDTKVWTPHAGEVLKLPGVEVEILYTQENYAMNFALKPSGSVIFGTTNNTNVITRLTVNETTVMMLGDAMPSENKWMATNYGDYLKSDILQLAHHGSNGGEITLYQTVDPDICIWPVEEERMKDNISNPSYNYNLYLMNDKAYGGTRDRIHHTFDTTVTYDCTDDGAVLRKAE